jgi:hypothetical protein
MLCVHPDHRLTIIEVAHHTWTLGDSPDPPIDHASTPLVPLGQLLLRPHVRTEPRVPGPSDSAGSTSSPLPSPTLGKRLPGVSGDGAAVSAAGNGTSDTVGCSAGLGQLGLHSLSSSAKRGRLDAAQPPAGGCPVSARGFLEPSPRAMEGGAAAVVAMSFAQCDPRNHAAIGPDAVLPAAAMDAQMTAGVSVMSSVNGTLFLLSFSLSFTLLTCGGAQARTAARIFRTGRATPGGHWAAAVRRARARPPRWRRTPACARLATCCRCRLPLCWRTRYWRRQRRLWRRQRRDHHQQQHP